MKRIKILGAGPSGLTAAINLAIAGYEVAVFEKRKNSGSRFAGDLQGLENWTRTQDILDDLAGFNLSINFDCTPFSSLYLSDGEGTSKNFSFTRPLVYLVKRGAMDGSLDQGLKTQAIESGVKFHFNDPIDTNEADIIASGPDNKGICAIDKGIVFKTSLPDMAIGLVNDRAAYKGYAYLLVTNGYGCLCTVLFDRFQQIDDCYQKTKEQIGEMVDLDIQNPKKVGGLGTFTVSNTFKKGDQLFVGEAAGLQDLLWGFGIRNAITSGYLAAHSIITGQDYKQLAQSRFKKSLKATVVLRYLYEKLSRRGYAYLIRKTASKPDTINFLYKAHAYQWIHKMVYPIAYRSLSSRYSSLKR